MSAIKEIQDSNEKVLQLKCVKSSEQGPTSDELFLQQTSGTSPQLASPKAAANADQQSSPKAAANADQKSVNSLDRDMFPDRITRQAFYRKVLLIMALQLSLSCLIVAPLLLIHCARNYLIQQRAIFFGAILLFWIVYAIIVWAYGISRTWPVNYIVLTLLTVSLAVIIACVCALVSFPDIVIGFVLSAALCFILGALASTSFFDLSILTGMISTFLFTLLVLIFLYILAPSRMVIWFILSFGLVLLMMYFIIDLQIIVYGKHRYNVTPNDYIIAATLLYVDIIFIFVFVIMMMVRR